MSNKNFSDGLIAKFWRFVDRRGDDDCWLWSGHIYPDGYGEFHYEKKRYRVHRFSYHLKNNFDPKNFFVCHKCDVRNCVNPKHLFLGTAGDNNKDCSSKNRHGNQLKTHCPQGHLLSGKNLSRSELPKRICRLCRNKRSLDRYYSSIRK